MSTKIEIEQITKEELEQLIRSSIQYALEESKEGNKLYQQTNQKEDLISRKEFLVLIGKSQSWLSKNMEKGVIPYHRIGRSIFFKLSEVFPETTQHFNNRIRRVK